MNYKSKTQRLTIHPSPFKPEQNLFIGSIICGENIIIELRKYREPAFRGKIIFNGRNLAFQRNESTYSNCIWTKPPKHKELGTINFVNDSLWIQELKEEPLFSFHLETYPAKHFLVSSLNYFFEVITEEDPLFFIEGK